VRAAIDAPPVLRVVADDGEAVLGAAREVAQVADVEVDRSRPDAPALQVGLQNGGAGRGARVVWADGRGDDEDFRGGCVHVAPTTPSMASRNADSNTRNTVCNI
jgi:hypothetical protein